MKSNFSPKIKRIQLSVHDFPFFHSSSSFDNVDKKFVGREKQVKEFTELLMSDSIDKGKYLVTGARGMGKTSFVAKVLNNLKNQLEEEEYSRFKLKIIDISLGDDMLNENDILVLLCLRIYDSIRYSKLREAFYLFIKICYVAICVLWVLLLFSYFNDSLTLSFPFKKLISEIHCYNLDWLAICISLATLIALYCIYKYQICFPIRLKVINNLKGLISQIDTSISKESGVNITAIGILPKIKKLKRETKIPLTFRELEYQIIYNLGLISKNVIKRKKGFKFIIVLDELDKVGSQKQVDKNSCNDEVLNLFFRLKHFFTEANARFIFISGREMRDAYLSSYSDRSNKLRSIFDRVINVDSFFTDSEIDRLDNIVVLTENLVCKFLIPSDLRLEYEDAGIKIGLKTYYNYLIDNASFNEIVCQNIVMNLYYYINTLMHISNGNPKIIVSHFENQLRQEDGIDLREDAITIRDPRTESKTFLVFTYFDQHKYAFINYLVTPLYYSVLNPIGKYSDKLLVSTSFLLNHIYKFHRNGFSFRNLEQSPELFDMNKSPELRETMRRIIDFLAQTHIQPVMTGIYRFKFPQKISQEIAFTSKLSEETSSLFGFTSEEVNTVLEFYKNQIYNSEENITNINKSSLQHIIGDLFFYNEEYNRAILSYKESLSFLASKLETKSYAKKSSLIVDYARVSLKLGLTYEKRKTYNSAYIVYSELVQQLMKYRDVKLDKIGLIPCSPKESIDESGNYEVGFSIKNEGTEKHYKSKEIVDILTKDISPRKDNQLLKISLFEDVRHIPQALLAKLFIMEKNQTGGITYSDLITIDSEFHYLYKTLNAKEKFIIPADFYKKFADILYFKNGLIGEYSQVFVDRNDLDKTKLNIQNKRSALYFFDIDPDLCKYDGKSNLFDVSELSYSNTRLINPLISNVPKEKQYLVKTLNRCLEKREKACRKKVVLSCYACKYYSRSLRYMISNFLSIQMGAIKGVTKTYLIIKALSDQSFDSLRFNYHQSFASALSSLGDTLLSCSCFEDKMNIRIEFISQLDKMINPHENRYDSMIEFMDEKGSFSFLEKILMYFYLSAIFYKKSSNHSSYIIQLKKIIFLIKSYLTSPSLETSNTSDPIGKYLSAEDEEIYCDLIKSLYDRIKMSTNVMNRHIVNLEKNRLARIFDFDLENTSDRIRVNHLTTNLIDYFDVIVSIMSINLVFNSKYLQNKIEDIDNVLMKPVSTIYNRMIYLKYSSDENKRYLNDENVVRSTTNSIFSLVKFLQFIAKFDTNTLFTNSYLAQVHFDLHFWIKTYYMGEQRNEIRDELNKLLDNDDWNYIDEEYHMERSKYYYFKTVEMHKEGRTYKNLIQHNYIINDGLNDDLFHFFIGLERYKLNSGQLNKFWLFN